MRFIQHYSSSKANLYEVVAGNDRRLLLECGVSWAKLEKALSYDLTNIDGCLVTHEHKDHCKAVKEVMKAGIDVYASEGTFKALGISDERRAVSVDTWFNIGDTFTVLCFPINHDAEAPLGYIVSEHGTDEYLLFCPDSSHIKQRFPFKFTIIAIECSYDKEILNKRVKDDNIHVEVAKRIVQSHASKETTLNYLQKYCDLSRCREIHLLHCSAENLDKEATKKEFKGMLFIETVVR